MRNTIIRRCAAIASATLLALACVVPVSANGYSSTVEFQGDFVSPARWYTGGSYIQITMVMYIESGTNNGNHWTIYAEKQTSCYPIIGCGHANLGGVGNQPYVGYSKVKWAKYQGDGYYYFDFSKPHDGIVLWGNPVVMGTV